MLPLCLFVLVAVNCQPVAEPWNIATSMLVDTTRRQRQHFEAADLWLSDTYSTPQISTRVWLFHEEAREIERQRVLAEADELGKQAEEAEHEYRRAEAMVAYLTKIRDLLRKITELGR